MVQQFQLPQLPYNLNDLEPIISKEIMDLHYNKHHAAYVQNLNKALEQYAEAEKNNDLNAMIALQPAIKFNGGGHINHSIFWTNLAPKNKGGGTAPEGPLAQSINQQFGSLSNFIEQFSNQTVAIQGSGWGWLGFNRQSGLLQVAMCPNQDPLLTLNLIPLLGIDVWEHAYYLQYKNARANYVKAIWDIINWKNVAERFEHAKTGNFATSGAR